jgi:hypothetical protein
VRKAAALWRRRELRRLALVVTWLALADRFVLPILEPLEHERYERGQVFRFENSDLFGLGPLADYLREHPKGDRPRTVFFGNSLVWGYGLRADTAFPAQFQKLHPDTKVFNIAINGFDMGSSYLIAKAMIDSVDRLYVLRRGTSADPMMPKLLRVSAEDARTFNVPGADRLEQTLERWMSWWRLYHYSYRLQAALWGSSTRQYIYLHKGELARSLVARVRAQERKADTPAAAMEIVRPMAPDSGSDIQMRGLEIRQPLMWTFASLARDHRKRTTFLHIDGYSESMDPEDVAVFNRVFAPFADIAVVRIPVELTFDRLHLTAPGSKALAEALRE